MIPPSQDRWYLSYHTEYQDIYEPSYDISFVFIDEEDDDSDDDFSFDDFNLPLPPAGFGRA